MNKKYSIPVYPKGPDKSPVELLFNSQEEHSEYIHKEANYCRKEQSEYLAELYNKTDRMAKKAAFYKKRVEFAKKSDFIPASATQWKKKSIKNHSGGAPLGVA